jgi:imidazolonepropionase-like amidohydrolase
MNARRSLLAGFTVLRNVGAGSFSDVALRDGIERGDVMGPHVFASGPLIGIIGGHCDENNLAPEYNYVEEGVADGVDAVRKMVRRNIKFGADLIKYCGTGGVFSKGDTPGAPQYTFEEAKAIVDEAHFMGRTVAVHAHGAEGIKIAIRAGADSIEHASLVDDEGIRMAVREGTVFSMDIYNTDYTQAEGKKNGTPEEYLQKDRDIAEIQRENFRKALKAGVKMSFGTDAGVYPNGDNAKQFAVMVRYGMTPMEAIVAASRTGAELLKHEKDFGAIAAGHFADIIAVRADPLADVSALEHVDFVMKEGHVYKGAPAQCAAAPSAWPCEAP